ncbi:hypothetical protein [Rossellomorea vietnamensis]|uniref:hypothetical protein n=1 Tax=Rossellomorea vietnamensis TaxID=218284 RepID=UPI0012DCF791|nr:hypothetical protein [Rossellomorea vietnamensis]
MSIKTCSLFIVSDEDNLYFERVGSLVSEASLGVTLDLGNDKADFEWSEVTRIN